MIIPAYNPDNDLTRLINQLSTIGFDKIILINDGSKDSEYIFQYIKDHYNIILLNHSFNAGKGAALKTGFKYYLEQLASNCIGVVTMDADGQHSVESVMIVAKQLQSNSNDLILGVRNFTKDIPLRSRFGNILTKKIFKLIHKIDLKDTQTGLRGIPNLLLKEFTKINYNRYEFETGCLIRAKEQSYFFRQVSIQTIYLKNNKSSHFNPIFDSLRIYCVFFRFVILSLCCFILDISLFMILFKFAGNVFFSTFLSRILSGYTNFHFNKHAVFKNKNEDSYKSELISYIILAITIASLSSSLVHFFAIKMNFHLLATKITIDSLLFLLSFLIQKSIIFKLKTEI